MYRYGQYCPVASAVEILGDRWTLLIVRDLLTGTRHFNDLERGLPGISRALLSERLRRLQEVGIIKKQSAGAGRRTAYSLTRAGRDLQPVIFSLTEWGSQWAFGEPRPEQLDPVLMLWWMRGRVLADQLPQPRVVIQFDFRGAHSGSYWLLLTADDVSLCLTPPGFEIDVLVTADLAAWFQLWLGRLDYAEALRAEQVRVEAVPRLARGFPRWFAWSPAAPVVRAVRSAQA
jgi:DNA-binding HxlR family transcriptional regulator